MRDKKTAFFHDERRGIGSAFGCLFRGLDVVRRVILNLIFFAIVITLLIMVFRSDSPDVPDTTALVLSPAGNIVDQLSGDPVAKMREELMGTGAPQTLLKNMLDAIEAASDDERVKVLFLDLDGLGGIGLSKLQDLKKSITEFKQKGKTVIATADEYDQNRYYLASLADEIFMHEMGLVILEGYGRYRMYYKEGLDKLEIDTNVFKVGKFKSAVEPFLRDNMSDAAKEANMEWLGDLWQDYLEDVAQARNLTVNALKDYIEDFQKNLKEEQGETAAVALKAGLIDHATTRDEIRKRMIELVGEDEDTHSFNQIGFKDYLKAQGIDETGADATGDMVGVIVAVGNILNGSQPPGKIGGDSTAALIRKARENENIKAIVLRVDSGGGSAFASEVIRREFELCRQAGKPVITSMGTVAASGGYWITMASDEVWASPSTITGSIGIFGMFPTYQKPLAKHLGIHVDGVGTTPLAGALRPDRELKPEVGEMIQLIINKGYKDFITKVAAARNMTVDEVDKIAQGRVWSGQDAHKLGLVDKLGDLDSAIASAAKLAELSDDYQVKYIKKDIGFQQKIIRELLSKAVSLAGPEISFTGPASPYISVARLLAKQAEKYAELNDPNGVYAYFPYEE